MSEIYLLVKKDTYKNPDITHRCVSFIDITPYETIKDFSDEYQILRKACKVMFHIDDGGSEDYHGSFSTIEEIINEGKYSWLSTLIDQDNSKKSIDFYYIILSSESTDIIDKQFYEYFDKKMKDLKEYKNTHEKIDETDREYLDLITHDDAPSSLFALYEKYFKYDNKEIK